MSARDFFRPQWNTKQESSAERLLINNNAPAALIAGIEQESSKRGRLAKIYTFLYVLVEPLHMD